jgi:hypothetical protein
MIINRDRSVVLAWDRAKAAGDRFHAIVGRGIYGAEDYTEAVALMTSQLG